MKYKPGYITFYNEWQIRYDPKPIPIRDFDWDFVHPNYDGADGGNGLAGNAASIEECIKHIKEIEEEIDNE